MLTFQSLDRKPGCQTWLIYILDYLGKQHTDYRCAASFLLPFTSYPRVSSSCARVFPLAPSCRRPRHNETLAGETIRLELFSISVSVWQRLMPNCVCRSLWLLPWQRSSSHRQSNREVTESRCMINRSKSATAKLLIYLAEQLNN